MSDADISMLEKELSALTTLAPESFVDTEMPEDKDAFMRAYQEVDLDARCTFNSRFLQCTDRDARELLVRSFLKSNASRVPLPPRSAKRPALPVEGDRQSVASNDSRGSLVVEKRFEYYRKYFEKRERCAAKQYEFHKPRVPEFAHPCGELLLTPLAKSRGF